MNHNVHPVALTCSLFGAVAILVFATHSHADVPKSTKKPAKLHPTLVQVKDTPGLPRVLLIGDSVSMWYTLPVRKLLDGKANVHRPPVNCHHSRQVLAELDSYLGDKPWDVIHLNCGGHDITYRINGDGAATPPPEGKIAVPLDEYKANLRAIVKRLKQTNAKIVWAATTPMGEEYIKKGYRFEEDIVKYNAAAAEIMKAEGIPINDLYSLAKPNADKLLRDGVHFTDEGSNVLAKAVGAEIQKQLPAAKKPHPGLVQVKDIPGLPRVLLIGDSISIMYTTQVRKRLEGQANVHRPPVNCHHSRQVLEELDSYLGEKPWDVVHFNCGVHDITHRVDGSGPSAPPPKGTITVPLDEYKTNLRAIVKQLKQTKAKIVWATTTPLSEDYDKKGFRREQDIVKYNAAAAEIMKAEGIPINDLYNLAKPNADKLLKDGVHFTTEGSEVLAKAVVEAIQKQLESAKPDK